MMRVMVVGGGASGVLLALHLLRDKRPGLLVLLVERRPELGAGIAYSTTDPRHFLNVRAANMSAFADEPDHFVNWLRARASPDGGPPFEPGSFAPRHLYRDYLASMLEPHLVEGRLRLIRAEAVAITPGERTIGVRFGDGTSRTVDKLVLATGNEGPSLPSAPWRHDGWQNSGVPSLDPDAAVVMVGTGLTMVDWVLSLLHAGHRGPITAISHRGLVPHPHRPAAPARLEDAEVPFGAPLSRVTQWLRHEVRRGEAAGGDWRGVIDSLRPHSQRLWQELASDDRRRFLRHVRPWWDQHRHRIAPEAAEQLKDARARGQFRVMAGRVVAFTNRERSVEVLFRRRGTHRQESLVAEAVFECRGRASDVTKTENPILRALLADGVAHPDRLRLGLDVTPECALVAADGHVSQRLYAVGPVTSGVFWEITAVPDIRVQVALLARRLNDARIGPATDGKDRQRA